MYASNCPVSRPAVTNIEVQKDFGGIGWNNKHGFVFVTDDEMPPIKLPAFASYRPMA